jgi:hypothetical protein
MKRRKLLTISILLLLLVFQGAFVGLRSMNKRLAGRPHWQISLRYSPDGAILDVYKSVESKPTYHVILKDQKIPHQIERLSRVDLPPAIGKTLSHDDTVKPGEWTLDLYGTEVQIMERALILNRSAEIMPLDSRALKP